MANLSYKDYQQVLTLGAPKPKSVAKSHSPLAPTKRRTKTGCLTCRKRKKKCDEDVVDGKCQGCTRNFLECCWSATPSAAVLSSISATPDVIEAANTIIDIKPKKFDIPKTPLHTAYPSPEMSPVPVFEGKSENNDIVSLVLPKAQFKISKPQRITKKPIEAKFVVTTVEKRRLVHLQ